MLHCSLLPQLNWWHKTQMVDHKLRVESCNQLATYTSVTDAYSLCLLNYRTKQWSLIGPHYYYCYLYWYLWWNARQGQLTEFFDLSITNTKCTKGKQLNYNLLGSYPMWDVTNHTIIIQFYKQDLLVYKVYPSWKSSHDFLLFWNCFIWLFRCWYEFGSDSGFWHPCLKKSSPALSFLTVSNSKKMSNLSLISYPYFKAGLMFVYVNLIVAVKL